MDRIAVRGQDHRVGVVVAPLTRIRSPDRYLEVFLLESSSTAASSAANPAATAAFLATFLVFLATLLRPAEVRFFVDL
jgi:hypothetical protein